MMHPQINFFRKRGTEQGGGSRRGRNLVLAGALAISAAGLIGGCATGDYTYVARISTGEKVEFPLAHGQPVPAKKDGVQVVFAGLRPSGTPEHKETVYAFAFTVTNDLVPRQIRIDDVTDESAVLLFEDKAPKLTDHHWAKVTHALKADDPWLHWLSYLDDSTRIFRFTITAADGHDIVLYQAWFVPSWMKTAMRSVLGMGT